MALMSRSIPKLRGPKPAGAKRAGVSEAAAALCAALAVAAAPVSAHDFWLQPARFSVPAGAVSPFTLQVGHGPFRQRSAIPVERITRVRSVGPGGAQLDLKSALRLGGPDRDGELRFSQPGLYVVALETDNHAQSRLPSLRYTDYLKAEGLTPALQLRERTHATGADGRESYSRRAKALLQVGPASAKPQSQATVPLGLTLEIVPERDPYALPFRDILPVRIIYEGRPLPGALVKFTNLEHDAAPLETHLTDGAGRAVFRTPRSGAWLLNVIWTKPVTGVPGIDFDTVFSSLSFGFPPAP